MAVPGKLVRSGASLRALAALKQGILKSIDVDKPSAAHVEGISPQDFIFSLGFLFSAHVIPPQSSLSDFQECLPLQVRLPFHKQCWKRVWKTLAEP